MRASSPLPSHALKTAIGALCLLLGEVVHVSDFSDCKKLVSSIIMRAMKQVHGVMDLGLA